MNHSIQPFIAIPILNLFERFWLSWIVLASQLSSTCHDTCHRDSQGVTAHLVSLQSTENSKPQVTELYGVGAPSFLKMLYAWKKTFTSKFEEDVNVHWQLPKFRKTYRNNEMHGEQKIHQQSTHMACQVFINIFCTPKPQPQLHSFSMFFVPKHLPPEHIPNSNWTTPKTTPKDPTAETSNSLTAPKLFPRRQPWPKTVAPKTAPRSNCVTKHFPHSNQKITQNNTDKTQLRHQSLTA